MAAERSDFERARQETVRYHEELYATASLGSTGTWLANPHRLLFDALALLPAHRPVVVYDLGAGIGRHTVPMMRTLPDGSVIHAVDLLATAVARLDELAREAESVTVHAQQADLAEFEFADDADLVFAFSAVKHLADTGQIGRLLAKIDAAMKPRGIVALGVVADRYEIDTAGNRRPALLESGVTVAEVDEQLTASFGGYDVISRDERTATVAESRDGEEYTLASTLVTWIARRP